MPTFDPLGRSGQAVDQQPHHGTDWPLLDPSDDVGLLLADFYLSFADDGCALAPPFRLDWLFGFDDGVSAPVVGAPTPAHDQDLRVLDDGDAVVFDSTLADDFASWAWGTRLKIAEWVLDETVCRVVWHTAWRPDQTPVTYPENLAPASAVLHPRSYRRLPRRLRKLVFGVTEVPAGRLRLKAGFNVDLTAPAATRVDGGRFVNDVVIAGLPGAGLGRQPGCEDADLTIATINRQGPDPAGNFVLDADDPFRLEASLAYDEDAEEYAAEPATLRLSRDGGAGCPDSYYRRTYVGVSRLHDSWQGIADDLVAARDLDVENRARWADQKECREARPLRVNVIPEAGGTLAVGASFCNVYGGCVQPVELRFDLQMFDGSTEVSPAVGLRPFGCGPALVKGSHTEGERPYALQATWPWLLATYPYLNQSNVATVRFRLKLPDLTAFAQPILRIAATVKIPDVPGLSLPVATPTVPVSASPLGEVRAFALRLVPFDVTDPTTICEA